MNSKVAIIIVNYKTANLTIECLRSLSLERVLSSFNVMVVDNDSEDGSFEKISAAIVLEEWSDWVSIKASGYNGGFASGNNIAIREFMAAEQVPEYIHLLNPDTVAREGAVSQLAGFLDTHQAVGIVGSRIEDESNQALLSAFKFQTWLSEMNKGFSLGVLSRLLKRWVSDEKTPERSIKTDWVSGASMMIRREVFEQIGFLDEAYFMYFEEMDFCFQANRSGWECWHVPASRVVHFVGQSSGITNKKMKKRMPTYWFNSRRRYFLKNFGVTHAALADLFWLIGFTSWRARNMIQCKEDNRPPGIFKDMLFNSVFFRGTKIKPVKNR